MLWTCALLLVCIVRSDSRDLLSCGEQESCLPPVQGSERKDVVLLQLHHGAQKRIVEHQGDDTLEDRARVARVVREGLVVQSSGLCLDSPQRALNNGLVHIWTCSSTNWNQQWVYDDTTMLIQNRFGICLSSQKIAGNGGAVKMWACGAGNSSQQWDYDVVARAVKNRYSGQCLDAYQRGKVGGALHMWTCNGLNENQKFLLGSPCQTSVEGERCYQTVIWAMNTDVFANPSRYPGLNCSSRFEDFQSFFYRSKNGGCNSTPCLPKHPLQAVSSLLSACAEVLNSSASDAWSKATCGQRISFGMSPAGGNMTQEQSRAATARDYSACAACWPWGKFKAAGDARLSRKRGISIQNSKLSPGSLSTLARTVVTWSQTWDFWPSAGPLLATWRSVGLEFEPMIWGPNFLSSAERLGIPPGSEALQGFNEPNLASQSHLTPSAAAMLWPRLERLAKDANITTLISPAMTFGAIDPILWLKEFFQACSGCRVDAIAIHSYTCYSRWLQTHLDMYRVFNKPLWITEFACSDAGSPERLDMKGQMAYMLEAVPLLEQDPNVVRYSWFSYFKDEWGYSIANGTNGDAGLIYANGSLSPLGKLYASLNGSKLVNPPVL